MASKWMKDKKEMFNKFKEEKKNEEQNNNSITRSDKVWKTPDKGTEKKPKIYSIRLLSDGKNFYKSIYYHMFKNTKGQWTFILCPKTEDFQSRCPFCSASIKLYKGSKEDKEKAKRYSRRKKHCINTFIVKDPRDVEEEKEEDKSAGKVKIYEFPDTVEKKIKTEQNDEENGYGMDIYDPGEDGVDFLLYVGATKPLQEGPNKGFSFHDYSESKFSNKSYALGTDEEIEEIMESVHDLDEHINSMKRKENDLVQIAKDEMLFDLIEEYFDDYKEDSETEQNTSEDTSSKEEESNGSEKEEKEEQENESLDEEIDDDDLLAVLDDLD